MNAVEKKRMLWLIARINEASDAYYGSGTEIMTNHEWDTMYDELKSLEASTGIIMANSPTQNVGGSMLNSTFEKVEHEISVKSLDKTKEVDSLVSFFGNHEVIMSWKLDGLTVVLTYQDGKLEKAVTRGKNGVGELITENARNFIGVPAEIPCKERLHIRGEALISYTDFDRVNENLPEGEEPYKNPRNLASGSVRQANAAEVKNRHVQFIAFSSSHKESEHSGEFSWLMKQGFTVVPHMVVKGMDIPDAVEMFRKEVKNNPYPTDGLVLQFNDCEYGESLGETDKFPRDAIAFKWQDEEKETVVKEIFWSPSRTGQITPVAVFDPIELEGTTVSRASVHNVGILEQLSITPGDTITVYKANMIIPQVSGNTTMLGRPVIPDTCPVCNGRTEIRIGRDGSRTLYCTNDDCSAKHIGQFVHAVKQDALNIPGVSEKTLEDLVDAGFLHTIADLFRLKDHAVQIAAMEGYGRKSVDNILSAIEAARTKTLDKVIYAFGIGNGLVGRTASKAICSHFDYDEVKVLNATYDELTAIEGVGNEIARAYVDWFANSIHQELFDDVLGEVTLQKPEKPVMVQNVGKPGINRKTIVITGDVQHFANRNAFKAWVEIHGGKLVGSVSRNTDFLVTNTPDSGTTKNKKAQELGVSIITEQQLIDMVE